jgi:hypothetical protein
VWCEWFGSLPKDTKSNVFERIWRSLSHTDQTAVITDLRIFIDNAFYALNGGKVTVAEMTDNESESDDVSAVENGTIKCVR